MGNRLLPDSPCIERLRCRRGVLIWRRRRVPQFFEVCGSRFFFLRILKDSQSSENKCFSLCCAQLLVPPRTAVPRCLSGSCCLLHLTSLSLCMAGGAVAPPRALAAVVLPAHPGCPGSK